MEDRGHDEEFGFKNRGRVLSLYGCALLETKQQQRHKGQTGAKTKMQKEEERVRTPEKILLPLFFRVNMPVLVRVGERGLRRSLDRRAGSRRTRNCCCMSLLLEFLRRDLWGGAFHCLGREVRTSVAVEIERCQEIMRRKRSEEVKVRLV